MQWSGMKLKSHGSQGLSLLEVVLVLATLALLIIVVVPMIAPRHDRRGAVRLNCVNNLKNVGLAARIYSGDHAEQFPWMVSTNFNPDNTSGSLEYVNSPNVFKHLQAMSNELNIPKILVCRSDVRKAAPDFAALSNTNLSYFVGLDAIKADPQLILSGIEILRAESR
jgi:competence protein ComGC